VRWDSRQQELAESFSNFDLFAFSEVTEGVLDDRDLIFVDHIILVITHGEDNRTMYGNSGTDEGQYKNVLIVDKGGVNTTERNICQTLPLSVGFLRLGSRAGGVVVLKEAGRFTFGLLVFSRDELRHQSLHPWRYCFPSTCIGGRGLGGG